MTFYFEMTGRNCPVEERWSCAVSFSGAECTLTLCCIFTSSHGVYFGNKVSGRPVSGCWGIDDSRLKCFPRGSTRGIKEAQCSWESIHIMLSAATDLSAFPDVQSIRHIDYKQVLSLMIFQILTFAV